MSKHISIALLAVLAAAATASASTVTLNDFLIFSGGGTVATGSDAGYETQIAGASLYIGNIGSNYDLSIGASETQVLGSVYVGGEFRMQAPGEIGTDGVSSFSLEPPLGNAPGIYPPLDVTVIANTGDFENATALIFGTLDLAGGLVGGSGTPTVSGAVDLSPTADTFAGLTLTKTDFTGFATGGTDLACNTVGCTSLSIAPNTLATAYGSLTIGSDKDVYLQSGTYYFEDITTTGLLDLYIDLTGGPVTIYVLNAATFGQNTELYVKGPGTGGQYVLIRDAPALAALINWQIGGMFTLGGGTGTGGGWGSIFGGYVYSSRDGVGVTVGQHIDWYGALWAYDTIDLADHSRYTYVPLDGQVVPEPATLLLLGTGLSLSAIAARRRLKKRT